MRGTKKQSTMMVCAILAVLAPLQVTSIEAQTQPASAATATSPDGTASLEAEPESGRIELKEGSPVTLSLASKLSSSSCREGDPVKFIVAEDVKVNDKLVVRSGMSAMGHVERARKSGMMGRGGELTLGLDYIQVNDTVVRVRGTSGKNGEDKTGAVVGLTVAFGVVGFMKHGKQAELSAGTNVHAYVDRSVELPALSGASF